jgi:hypothetical protein
METPRTLRAYFLFFGIIGVLVNYGRLEEGSAPTWLPWIGLAVYLLYLYIGLMLHVLLKRSPRQIRFSLLAYVFYSTLYASVRLFLGLVPRDEILTEILSLATGVSLALYVTRHVDFLVNSRQSAAPAPALTPPRTAEPDRR